MRFHLQKRDPSEQGLALIIVVAFAAVSLLTLGGVVTWTENNAHLTDYNNRFFGCLAAAEAATEKAVSLISKDFQTDGESLVYSSMANYRLAVPLTSESEYWSDWEFSNAQGLSSANYVQRMNAWGWTELQSQYSGLKGMASTYRVISNARNRAQGLSSSGNIIAGVRQDFQVAQIPVFQFAIFYGIPMEISCGQPFNVTGRVHANSDLWVEPDNTLTFKTHVTAVGDIKFSRRPGDSRGPPTGTVRYDGEKDSKVGSLNLPIGTNNTPEAVHAILEVPPPTENPLTPMGRERYYNKADLIITVSNNVVRYTSGLFNNFATSWTNVSPFVVTNASFRDAREGKFVRPIDVNVGNLKTWSTSNTVLRSELGRDVRLIYVIDKRILSSTNLSAVRLINGSTLPGQGLSVATERPVYVLGHYNAPNSSHRGTTNTSATLPASIISDAITILSTAWTDANSTAAVASRVGASTTVNAAFLSGVVETPTFSNYSGGAENFPRFLETWGSSRIFTYNGSMVVMFPSRYATNRWGLSNVYSPPARNWSFDFNFTDPTKLPAGTPQLRTLIRGQWSIIQPGRTS